MGPGWSGERQGVAGGDEQVGASEWRCGDADDTAHHVERDDADRDEDDRGEEPAAHELEDRQGEEVEADVPTEDRVGRAERHGVQPTEERVPLVAAGEPEEEGRDKQERHEPEGQRERPGGPRRIGVDHEPRHVGPEREVEIREGEEEEDEQEDDERPEPGGVAAQEDILEAEAPEPEEIGEEPDDRTEEQGYQEQREDDDRDERRHPVPRAPRRAGPAESRNVDAGPVDVPPVAATGAVPHAFTVGVYRSGGRGPEREPRNTRPARSAHHTSVTATSTGAARTSEGKSNPGSARSTFVT